MNDLARSLLGRHDWLEERPSVDLPAFNCPQDKLKLFLKELRDQHGFDFLTDITAIDYFEVSPRYIVVYHLLNSSRGTYVRIASPCRGDEDPVAVSVVDMWPAADWHERETYDMFGIQFEGHPDLRRILMWDGYPYYPLRKEFPLAGHEVELPDPDITERTGAKVKPAPMMGGPFHSGVKGTMAKREPRADDESWTEVKFKSLDGEEQLPPREFRPTKS